jgi:hypothetical protein
MRKANINFMHLRLFSVRHLLLTRQIASHDGRTRDDGLPALGLHGNHHSRVIRAQKLV